MKLNKKRKAAKPLHEFRQPFRKTYILKEGISRKDFGPMLQSFVDFASEKLGIAQPPAIYPKDDDSLTFAHYDVTSPKIAIQTKNRHPMDIFRSVAHELVHHHQKENGRLSGAANEGETGSDIENEANAMAGQIMRWYAQANPQYFKLAHVTEAVALSEGLYDKARHKAVFVVGGPGSGKDYIVKHAIMGHGLVEVNPDHAFEHAMRKHNLDLKMQDSQRDKRNALRYRASELTDNRTTLHIKNRNGIIVNSTGSKVHKIHHLKNHLENLGYDTKLVFVHTSNETSAKRNQARERTVPENVRQEKYQAAQASKEHYKKMFGDRYSEINNDMDYSHPEHQKAINTLFKKIRKFVDTKPDNPVANQWAQQQLATKQQQHMKEDIDGLFESFIKQQKKKERRNHLSWSIDDLHFHKRLHKIKIKKKRNHLSWSVDDLHFHEKPHKINEETRNDGSVEEPHYRIVHENIDDEFIQHEKKFEDRHKNAISEYKTDSSRLNGYLRSSEIGEYKEDHNIKYDNWAKNLDRVTSHPISQDIHVYKGFNTRKAGYINNFQPGTRFTDHGFASTTINKEKAFPFSRSLYKDGTFYKTMFKIHVPKGTYAHYLDNSTQTHNKHDDERELLLARRTHFEVTHHTQEKNDGVNYHIVHLKVIGQGKNYHPDQYKLLENSKPSEREFGTNSLRNIYTRETPGQTRIKLKKKKIANEEGLDKNANGIETILPVDAVGTTINGPKGTAYIQPFWESMIQKWENDPTTLSKFKKRYGEMAELKLFEAVSKLKQIEIRTDIRPKSISQLLENFQKR